MGITLAGVDLIAMLESKSNYSSLAPSSCKEVVSWDGPDGSAAPADCGIAAQDWPNTVITAGKRRGSPALAHTSLTEEDRFCNFMTTVTKGGSQPDSICLHYFSTDGDVSSSQSYIEGVYIMYKLLVWVIVWAYIDYRTDPAPVPSTADQVAYAGGDRNEARLELCRTLRRAVFSRRVNYSMSSGVLRPWEMHTQPFEWAGMACLIRSSILHVRYMSFDTEYLLSRDSI